MRFKANPGHVEQIPSYPKGTAEMSLPFPGYVQDLKGTAVLYISIYSRYHRQVRSPGRFADHDVL